MVLAMDNNIYTLKANIDDKTREVRWGGGEVTNEEVLDAIVDKIVLLGLDFSIKYTEVSGTKEYTITMSFSKDRDFEFLMLGGEDKVLNSASGKLSGADLKHLETWAVGRNRFFNMPEDLSNFDCLDGSDQYLEVEYYGKHRKVGGYCVQDVSFRDIVERLGDYKDGFVSSPPIAERV